jgi:DNA polymerase I
MVRGCVHVDLYCIVRRHLQLKSHTIGNVYFELFIIVLFIVIIAGYFCFQKEKKRLRKKSIGDFQA